MITGPGELPAMRRRQLLHAGSLAAVAGLAGCTLPGTSSTTESDTRTLDVPDGTPIAVTNQNGRVAVDTHDADAPELTVTKRSSFDGDRFDEVAVETGIDDGTYSVAVRYDSNAARTRVSVTIDLSVPAEQPVTRARTANGEVAVEDTTGDLIAVSQNGSVDVAGIDGYVTARTANGSVDVVDVTGLDGAQSSNGSVDVEIPAIRDDTLVRTGNGSIDANLGPDLDADLTASTSVGSIDVEDVPFSESDISNREVTGLLGDGGPTLSIRAGNGSIDLRPLE